jgi:hypothetical protein
MGFFFVCDGTASNSSALEILPAPFFRACIVLDSASFFFI